MAFCYCYLGGLWVLYIIIYSSATSLLNNLEKKHSSSDFYNTIICNDYTLLKNNLEKISELFENIEKNQLNQKLSFISEYKINPEIWRNKITIATKLLTKFSEENLRQRERGIKIDYPNNKSLIELKSDANTLLGCLKKGYNITGVLFKGIFVPKNIRQTLYFINEVKINGIPCTSIKLFNIVLEDIEMNQDLDELKIIFGLQCTENLISCSEKILAYKQQLNFATELISNIRLVALE